MLNIFISTSRVKFDDIILVERKVYDIKEKIDISLEIQTELFWKKDYNLSKYFYLLSTEFSELNDNQSYDCQRKFMYLKKRQEKKLEEEIRMNGVEQKISGVEQKINELEISVKEILNILRK